MLGGGLSLPDVFYFGNAIGESGDSASDAIVEAADDSPPAPMARDLGPHRSTTPTISIATAASIRRIN